MKIVRTAMVWAFAVALMISCVSSPDMNRINVSSGVSSQILNLKNSGNGNTGSAKADRIMKNFLNTGEEYGYYTLDMTSKYVDGGLGFPGVLSALSLGTLCFLGMPTDYEDYTLTVNLDILDSNRKVIRSYSDSAIITQWGGFYYGDATDEANAEFTRLVRNVQQQAAAEGSSINRALRAAGPIGSGQAKQTVQSPDPQPRSQENDIEGALDRAAKVIMTSLQNRNLRHLKIAIVNISSLDKDQSVFVAGELEYLLDKNGFTIVDRSELDRVRREQNFQLSGEVNEDQIRSIGKFAGASLVITGRIDGSGSTRRLRLRVLDTESAEVRGTASEPF